MPRMEKREVAYPFSAINDMPQESDQLFRSELVAFRENLNLLSGYTNVVSQNVEKMREHIQTETYQPGTARAEILGLVMANVSVLVNCTKVMDENDKYTAKNMANFQAQYKELVTSYENLKGAIETLGQCNQKAFVAFNQNSEAMLVGEKNCVIV